mgnify:CR=1 FL=1
MNKMQRPTDNLNDILSQYGVKNPCTLFVEAVAEGSNRERDWLWYADQMTQPGERRYCWERALYINPNSSTALDNLKRLAAVKPAFALHLGRLFQRRNVAAVVSSAQS